MSVGLKYYNQTILFKVHVCVLLLYVKKTIHFNGKKIKKKVIYVLIGNICIGSVPMLSGILFAQMVEFCQVLKLHFFITSYEKIIKYYIGPVVYDVWTYHKQDNINNLKTLSNIWLAGDGQYDSPGFCAKYCFYSVMDLNSCYDFSQLLK